MRLCALVILALAVPVPVYAACPAGLAVYSHIEDNQFSLSLSKQENPKAWSNIEIAITGPDTSLRYELTASNGYSRNFLVPIPLLPDDEEKDGASIDFFDKELKRLDLPQASQAAPEFVFSSDLGAQLYYKTNAAEKPILLPQGMWKLSGCAE